MHTESIALVYYNLTKKTHTHALFLYHSGSVINGPFNTTTHTNVNPEDTSNNLDDGQDIGVIGKGKNEYLF